MRLNKTNSVSVLPLLSRPDHPVQDPPGVPLRVLGQDQRRLGEGEGTEEQGKEGRDGLSAQYSLTNPKKYFAMRERCAVCSGAFVGCAHSIV